MRILLFWDRLRQLRRPGGLGSTDEAQFNDRVVHSLELIAAQYWGLPLHKISTIFYTLQVMAFSLMTSFGDLDIIDGGTSTVVILRGGFTKNEGLALRGRPSFTYFT